MRSVRLIRVGFCLGLLACTFPWTVSATASYIGGVEIPADIDTPVDYPGSPTPGEPTTAWFHVLEHPGATYVALHFVGFELGPGDYLVVADGQGGQEYTLTGRGKMQAGTFWARHIKGDTVVLSLIAVSAEGGRGFGIDAYTVGDAAKPASVYPPDDRENAICYVDSHPTEYDRGRAVVRLLTNGNAFCTGSLVSPYNHVLTNNHCVYTAEGALNTDFELMAEAPHCEDANCPNCYPGVLFSGGTLVARDPALDYALILLGEGDPASTFGYLEFDNRQAVVGEQIYFPQHSGGRAKEFAIYSTHPDDTGGVARIQSITVLPCISGTHQEVGYYADSEGGSSGSPILATASHKLIALNHCQGSINMGVGVNLFYEAIESHILGFMLPGRIAAGSVAVAADSASSGHEADGAIDREIGTQWISAAAAGPHWLQLDLGLQAPVHGFKVWHTSAGGGNVARNTRAFEIQSAPEATGPWHTEFIGDNAGQAPVSTFAYPGPQTLRHVRLYVTDPGDDDVARICELEVVSEPGMIAVAPTGPNVAPQAVAAEASSTFAPEWGAHNAIDGVLSETSKWASADTEPPHSLTLDLGDACPVIGFILRQPSAAGEPGFLNMSHFAFQSGRAMTGPWYTEAEILTDGVADFEGRTFIAPKDLRYVRLLVLDPGPDDVARVPEFEVLTYDGPVALFGAVPSAGHPPLAVAFTDLSIGSVDAWHWEFGDGGTSNERHSTHTYDTIGDFTVSLTVSGPDGDDTETKMGYIRVVPLRTDFDADADVDLDDYGHLQACYSGPGTIQTDPACQDARLDTDEDVDQDDFEVFAACLTGARVPADPGCLSP